MIRCYRCKDDKVDTEFSPSAVRVTTGRCCKPCTRIRTNERRHRRRDEMLAAYGGKCACCGETTKEFLALDHTYGNGGEHRRKLGYWGVMLWLRKNGYPQEGFRLLCHNCNQARGCYGYCPHEANSKTIEGA